MFYRWVQSECRKLGDSDGPEVSPLLQQASQVLRERPVLFKYCAMEVATTRHNALFQRQAPRLCCQNFLFTCGTFRDLLVVFAGSLQR